MSLDFLWHILHVNKIKVDVDVNKRNAQKDVYKIPIKKNLFQNCSLMCLIKTKILSGNL